jgi:hypothetical protein
MRRLGPSASRATRYERTRSGIAGCCAPTENGNADVAPSSDELAPSHGYPPGQPWDVECHRARCVVLVKKLNLPARPTVGMVVMKSPRAEEWSLVPVLAATHQFKAVRFPGAQALWGVAGFDNSRRPPFLFLRLCSRHD